MSRAWVGTSGYSYPQWLGVFYPEKLPKNEWFRYYAEQFSGVEINLSFYRLPTTATFRGWAKDVPEDFRFVLKGHRYVTHVRRLADVTGTVRAFFDRAAPLESRLACVLWQLPPGFRADPARLGSFLGVLAEAAPPSVRHAFEFRDESWFEGATYEILERAGAAVVLADYPFQVLAPGMRARLPERPPVHVPHTADFVYVRRHGPGEDYTGGYTDRMVETDAAWVAKCLDEGKDAFVFYAKEVPHAREHGTLGLRDAQQLADLLREGPVAEAG